MRSQIKKIIMEAGALLTEDEGFFLYDLALKTEGNIVEIGSFTGGSTAILAKGLKDPYKVFAIDPHEFNGLWLEKMGCREIPKDTSLAFKNNMKKFGVAEKVVLIEKKSGDAIKYWNKKIGLLWIDGDHSYEGVKSDFLQWEPFLKKNGIIAFHDSFYGWNFKKKILPAYGITHEKYDGSAKVVQENLANSKNFCKIGTRDTITAFTKKHHKLLTFSATFIKSSFHAGLFKKSLE